MSRCNPSFEALPGNDELLLMGAALKFLMARISYIVLSLQSPTSFLLDFAPQGPRKLLQLTLLDAVDTTRFSLHVAWLSEG